MLYLKRIIKALLSGTLIGIAGIAFIIAKYNGFKVLPSLLFPIGLFLICTFSYDLYTGKIGYLLKEDNEYKILDLLLMLLFNLIGAFIVGILYYFSIKDSEILNVTKDVWNAKFLSLSFVNSIMILGKSMLCGVLVFIAVDLFKKTNSDFGKFIAVWIPIFLFVFLGLDHSIANMFYMAAAGTFTIYSFVDLIIAIIGNSLGSIIYYLLNNFIFENVKQ